MEMVSGNGTEEKRIKHYSSSHKMLLVGEGDFSLSACLARTFGSATNMVATSLDSKVEVCIKYSNAATHLKELEECGSTIIHQVDVHIMSLHPLLNQKFDRIIFNFPHASLIFRQHVPYQIQKHQELVKGFLENAAKMLSVDGEIHVTHKKCFPFDKWEIEELANQVGLFTHMVKNFSKSDYPGYCNKKGYWFGGRFSHDRPFPVGECSTFMFKLQRG